MFITLCILYHSGQFFPRASPLPWQISEARMWGAHTTFLTLLCQDAGAESLHPAFVTVSRTCNPECSRGGCCDSSGSAELLPCRTAPPGQWEIGKGSWMWSTGILALLSFTKLSLEHKLWKPGPANTSKINMIPQLGYLYPELAPKTLGIQRLGNFREKWLGEGVKWHEHSKKSLYINQQVHNHICHQGLYKSSNCNVCII